MKNRARACPGKDLEQFSTEQLDEILQTELKRERPDESVVLPILQELQKREKDYPVETPVEITGSADERANLIHIDPKKSKRKRRWALRIAAVAAAIGIVLMAIPRTVGAESVFQVLFRWTESVFEFFSPGDGQDCPTVDYAFETDNQGLQKLFDMMVAMGVQDSVVPMWLPEGYELSELKVVPYPDGDKVYAEFVNKNSNDKIVLSYRIYTEKTSAQYEKEYPGAKPYEYDEITHYILVNKEKTSVAWLQNTVECVISTNLDEETACKIVASIYRSEQLEKVCPIL